MSAGKGSGRRKGENPEAFSRGYQKVDFKSNRSGPGRCAKCGREVPNIRLHMKVTHRSDEVDPLEVSLLLVESSIQALQERADFIEELDNPTEAQLEELEWLRRDIRHEEDRKGDLLFMRSAGYLHHKGPGAPYWFDDEDTPGERFSATSGSHPCNEWYACVDKTALETSLLNGSRCMQCVTQMPDGSVYLDEDVVLIDDGTAGVRLVVRDGAESLGLQDLVLINSVF